MRIISQFNREKLFLPTQLPIDKLAVENYIYKEKTISRAIKMRNLWDTQLLLRTDHFSG